MLHAAMLEDSHDAHDHSEGEGHDDHSHEAAGHEGDHSGDHHDVPAGSQTSVPDSVGIFFSIYYCMTGLHAIHIIGGIIALAWLYRRSQLGHWREDYFGPVDYVGLYWHLVDLIWIYLFPLLYLID
jgi:cytochrome c oxidase subunit 3